jgi:hypothetical protein
MQPLKSKPVRLVVAWNLSQRGWASRSGIGSGQGRLDDARGFPIGTADLQSAFYDWLLSSVDAEKCLVPALISSNSDIEVHGVGNRSVELRNIPGEPESPNFLGPDLIALPLLQHPGIIAWPQ